MKDADLVAEAALCELGPVDTWKAPSGYPDSLALCIIDSVFSLRVKYTAVEHVVAAYRAARAAQGGAADTDGTPELVEAIATAGGPESASVTLFNNRGLAPGTKALKSTAVANGAASLLGAGILTASQFKDAIATSDASRLRGTWLGVAGLGPASWNYLAMLTGADDVKADTWIIRYVSRVVGERTTPQRAAGAVKDAARALHVPATLLDHRIWRYESGRDA